MRRVTPFAMADLADFTPHQTLLADLAGSSGTHEAAAALSRAGSAWTLRAADGTVLAFAGLARIDASCAHAWAFMAATAGQHMVWLTRVVRRFLDRTMERHRRIECMVRVEFAPGCIWAHLLGFEEEGPAYCMAPDGSDMIRFARINRDWERAAA